MPVEQVIMIATIMIMITNMMITTVMMMMMILIGVWEDNDPSLSVQCAEGRPRALPRVEVTQVSAMPCRVLSYLLDDHD